MVIMLFQWPKLGITGWTIALLVVCLQPTSAAESPRTSIDEARPVFELITDAWLVGDHTLLSESVSPEGVLIAVLPQLDRENLYSSSQAFYFFKNLFQSTRTDSFEFRRLQDKAEAGLAHAVAIWRYRRTGSNAINSERLFFTLTHGRTGWGLSEIRTLR
jgi:hypothetical protein